MTGRSYLEQDCLWKRLLSSMAEAVLMCLRSQGRVRIRAVLLGVLIGLGLAGCLIMWTNYDVYIRQKSVMRYNAGKRSVSYSVCINAKPNAF